MRNFLQKNYLDFSIIDILDQTEKRGTAGKRLKPKTRGPQTGETETQRHRFKTVVSYPNKMFQICTVIINSKWSTKGAKNVQNTVHTGLPNFKIPKNTVISMEIFGT